MMKKWMKTAVKLLGFLFNSFNLLMFFAMRPCWSGISKTLGYEKSHSLLILNLPLVLVGLFLVLAAADLLCLLFVKKDRIWPWLFLGFGAAFLVAVLIIIKMGAADYMRFIWPNFYRAVGAWAVLLALYYLLFKYPDCPLRKLKPLWYALFFAAILGAGLLLTRASANGIKVGAVVYAVENEYQITFSGKADSLGWVTVGDQSFYETYAGSKRSERIHKISVPMEVLDQAKSYTIHLQQMIYRGPFGGLLGKELTKEYSFTPVNAADGLTYFAFSDIHMRKEASLKTESFAETYDFLVLNGDMVSMVDSFDDANYANELASAMTGGSIPVIYARGNHEIKGKYAMELHRYVGAAGENFYYGVQLDSMYALGLDLGEDHDDDWWEYYGTAEFDAYHREQLRFVKRIGESEAYQKADYHLVICHIPLVFVNSRHNHEGIKADMTALLNTLSVDMALYGHQHDIMIFEPGVVTPGEKLTYNPDYRKGSYKGYLTDFNFPGLMISKPGYTQTDGETAKSQVGLLVKADFKTGTQTGTYRNSRGETLSVVNPFAPVGYGKEVCFPMAQ